MALLRSSRYAVLLLAGLFVGSLGARAVIAGGGEPVAPKASPPQDGNASGKDAEVPPAPKKATEGRPVKPRVPVGPARPGSLRALDKRIFELAKEVARIVAEAARDPDESVLDIYLAYSGKELKNRKRKVRAEDLLRVMTDPSNAQPLRERAWRVLKDGSLRGDIELSTDHKKAGLTERSWFASKRVADHLKDDTRDVRRLTHTLLEAWYRVRGVTAIISYKYDEKKTWTRAIAAWKKELKRRK